MNSQIKKYLITYIPVTLIPIGCVLPFLTKAYHIDDPPYLWIAQHIVHHPFDFYGFSINWYGYETPVYEINQNPPLVPYFLALSGYLWGWHEIPIHLSMMGITVALVIGIYQLATLMCKSPLPATLISIFTPVFLVSSTTVMCDMMMVMGYVWAVYCWIRGVKKKQPLFTLLSAIFICISIFSKYFGISLIPLLLVYTFIGKYEKKYLLFLFIPLIALGVYQWITYRLYGYFLVSNAAKYAIDHSLAGQSNAGLSKLVVKAITGLNFVGGCGLSVIFFFPLIWKKQSWIGVSVIGLLSLGIITYGDFFAPLFQRNQDIQWGLYAQFFIYFFLGIIIIFLALLDGLTYRDDLSILLGMWIIGTIVFSTFINWTTNARSLLPLAPLLGILIVRRIHQLYPDMCIRKFLFPLFLSWAISLCVAYADNSLANAQKDAVYMIDTKWIRNSSTVWFQGHWGFQYYMQQAGAKPVDYHYPKIQNGHMLVIPLNNCNILLPETNDFQLVDRFQISIFPWLATMDPKLGAGFYGAFEDIPFPFVFGPKPPEEYLVFRYVQEIPNDR